ncbi:hypothetical protein Hanom_Chr12g01100311 [Helianthus anomalus]
MVTSVMAGTTMKLAKLNTNTVMKRCPSPDVAMVFSAMMLVVMVVVMVVVVVISERMESNA